MCEKKIFFHSDHLISPSLLFTSVHERVNMKCGVHIARVPYVCVCACVRMRTEYLRWTHSSVSVKEFSRRQKDGCEVQVSINSMLCREIAGRCRERLHHDVYRDYTFMLVAGASLSQAVTPFYGPLALWLSRERWRRFILVCFGAPRIRFICRCHSDREVLIMAFVQLSNSTLLCRLSNVQNL